MPEVTITGVAAGGDGIGRLEDGRVIFCQGGLPGERVDVAVDAVQRDFARGRVISVLDASPLRVEPPCPYVVAGCGGCPWQHISEEGHLELKAEIVRDALRRIAHLDPQVVRPSPPERGRVPLSGYRTSARLAVDPDGRPAYRRRHSHDLMAVHSCLVAHPALAELITDARFPGARDVRLRVSATTGERSARPDRHATRARVPAGTVVSAGAERGAVTETVDGRRWRVSAESFFQSGPDAATVLVGAVRAAAGDVAGRRVADLYAGVGLLGGSVAATARALVAVKSNRVAAADAVHNLVSHDARVVVADTAVASSGEIGDVDLVIADPARAGLSRAGTAAVVRTKAPVVILVSCDPASMARDVALLGRSDYRLDAVEVLDLFPGTFHIETVSRLLLSV